MTEGPYNVGDKSAGICLQREHLVGTTFVQHADGLLVAVCKRVISRNGDVRF
jgi:hypothetical protein